MNYATLALASTLALGVPALSQATYPQAPNQADQQTAQDLRTQGYNAGFRAGVTDYQNHAPYNVQSNPVYQNSQEGDEFRSGFEAGYNDGYNGLTTNRPANAAAQPGAMANSGGGLGAGPAVQGSGDLPAGTTMQLKLNNALSTQSSNAGDRFTASVSAPVYSQNNQVLLVPQGSTVEGTVASVQRSGGLTGTSQIQLNFQQLRLPNGESLPLRAEVSGINPHEGVGGAITGAPSTTNEGGVQQSQTRRTVGTAAASGAVGALIGAIAGGGKGAAIGTLLGGGLGVVLANKNGALDLPAGTPITITLNSPVRIRQ